MSTEIIFSFRYSMNVTNSYTFHRLVAGVFVIPLRNSVVFVVDDFPEFCDGKSQSPTALKGTPVTIHHYVKDCDAAIKRAQDAGATVSMPAADMFWGDRYGQVTDPFGHRWSFATHIKDVTPDEMRAAMANAGAPGS
jgi:PhnB protein